MEFVTKGDHTALHARNSVPTYWVFGTSRTQYLKRFPPARTSWRFGS